MRARYSSICCSPPGCKQPAALVEWDPAQRVPATSFQRASDGVRCVSFSMARARISHDARATRLGCTHGLKLYATTTTTSNACPVCRRTVQCEDTCGHGHANKPMSYGSATRAGSGTEKTECASLGECPSSEGSMTCTRLPELHALIPFHADIRILTTHNAFH